MSNIRKGQLTKSIVKANENRLTDNSDFDIYQELENVLQGVGLSAKDSGETLHFTEKIRLFLVRCALPQQQLLH
ncbi:hypothetical protein [Priestia megaterium]